MHHLQQQNPRTFPGKIERNDYYQRRFLKAVPGMFRMPAEVSDEERVVGEDLIDAPVA